MKNILKKALSILLAVILSVGSVSFCVYSDNRDDENQFETYINPRYMTRQSLDSEIVSSEKNTSVSENTAESVPISTETTDNKSVAESHQGTETKTDNCVDNFTDTGKETDNISLEEILTDQIAPTSSGTAPAPVKRLAAGASNSEKTIQFGKSVSGSLSSSLAEDVYNLKVTNRGVIRYGFGHDSGDGSSCAWEITLYMAYSPDGISTEKRFREIYSTSYKKLGTPAYSSYIGVIPGDYRLVVSCTSGFTKAKYTLAATFEKYYKSNDGTLYNFEVECGNTINRYTELPLNRAIMGTASRYTDNTTDQDWFMFTVTDAGYAELYFTQTNPKSAGSDTPCWLVRLCDENGKTYFSNSVPVTSAELSSGIIGLKKGNYFISITPLIDTDSVYTIKASFTFDSYIEHESNDTAAEATPLVNQRTSTGSLSDRADREDIDFFTFTLGKKGYALLKFEHDELTRNRNGWRITLLDEKNTIIYQDLSAHNSKAVASPYIGLDKGKYYIKIDSNGLYRETIPYYLTVASIESDSWEYGDNSSIQKANPISVGKTIHGSLIALGLNYDTDYYSFQLDKKCDVTVNFEHENLLEDKEGWMISLLDASGKVIYSTKSSWADKKKSFTSISLPAGKYYISVETGLYFNSARYDLTVNI